MNHNDSLLYFKTLNAQEIKGFSEFEWPSNFYILEPFIFENIEYSTTENFYQAMKSNNPEIRLHISKLKPGQSKRYTKKDSFILRDDWEDVKYSVMETALRIKFGQEKMAKFLLATRDIYIEETNTWDDVYWGVCNGVGLNHLGLLLMKIRNELQRNNDE